MTQPVLIFVYNADTGFFNLVSDIAHKMLSPETYACNLCKITHSNFGMREEWKSFFAELDAELEFLHRDEFIKKFRMEDMTLPAVFVLVDEKPVELVRADEINACHDTLSLQMLISDKSAAYRNSTE